MKQQHINDNSKPLIFIGSNSNLEKYIEVCDEHDIEIHGIMDSDYFGNTESLSGIPVIDSEHSFVDTSKAEYYRTNFNFFCATNWIPMKDPVSIRNKDKRLRLIELIKDHGLDCISLLEHQCKVSKFSTIGRGVYLDYLVLVSPNVSIGDFTCIYNGTSIGHHSTVGENCVIQGDSIIMSDCTVGNNVYCGTGVRALKSGIVIGDGTFVHEMVYLRRSTHADETVVSYNTTPRVYRNTDALLAAAQSE